MTTVTRRQTTAPGPELPALVESVRHITELGKPTVRQVLAAARDAGDPVPLPRPAAAVQTDETAARPPAGAPGHGHHAAAHGRTHR